MYIFFCNQTLKAQVENTVDSWLSAGTLLFLKKYVHPLSKRITTNNIGSDGTGTHEGSVDNVKNINGMIPGKSTWYMDKNIENNPLALNRWKIYHKQKNKAGIPFTYQLFGS